MSRAIDFMFREGHMIWARLNSEEVLSDIRRRRSLSKISYIVGGLFASAVIIGSWVISASLVPNDNGDNTDAYTMAKLQMGSNRFENSSGGVTMSEEVTSTLTSVNDVKGYIDDQVKALNSGKSVDCDVVKSVKSNGWKDSQGAYSMPACVKFKGGNNIQEHTLVFSYLKASEQYMRLVKFAGVFHEVDGKWTYTNIKLSGTQSFEVEGFDSVSIVNLQDTLINDFPDLYPQEEVDRFMKSMKGVK